MRIEFKKQKIRASKFLKWCKNNNADYFETDEEGGIWIIPKRYGDSFASIRLLKDGKVNFGKIDDSCQNFISISISTDHYKEEQEWFIQTLTLFKKYKP